MTDTDTAALALARRYFLTPELRLQALDLILALIAYGETGDRERLAAEVAAFEKARGGR